MSETRSLSEGKGGFNARGRKVFPFANLDKMNINTFKKLEQEAMLVNEKKSTRSCSERISIARAYFMCVL